MSTLPVIVTQETKSVFPRLRPSPPSTPPPTKRLTTAAYWAPRRPTGLLVRTVAEPPCQPNWDDDEDDFIAVQRVPGFRGLERGLEILGGTAE